MLKNYGAGWGLIALIVVAVVGNAISQPPPKSPYYAPKSEQKQKPSAESPACRLINVSGLAVSEYPIRAMPNLSIADRELLRVWTNMDLGPGSTSAAVTALSNPAHATRVAKAGLIKALSEGTAIAFV